MNSILRYLRSKHNVIVPEDWLEACYKWIIEDNTVIKKQHPEYNRGNVIMLNV